MSDSFSISLFSETSFLLFLNSPVPNGNHRQLAEGEPRKCSSLAFNCSAGMIVFSTADKEVNGI